MRSLNLSKTRYTNGEKEWENCAMWFVVVAEMTALWPFLRPLAVMHHRTHDNVCSIYSRARRAMMEAISQLQLHRRHIMFRDLADIGPTYHGSRKLRGIARWQSRNSAALLILYNTTWRPGGSSGLTSFTRNIVPVAERDKLAHWLF